MNIFNDKDTCNWNAIHLQASAQHLFGHFIMYLFKDNKDHK